MSERPEAFIYEEINYPEGMFHESLIKSKQKQGEAGKKVYQRFVKGKRQLNKYQKILTPYLISWYHIVFSIVLAKESFF